MPHLNRERRRKLSGAAETKERLSRRLLKSARRGGGQGAQSPAPLPYTPSPNPDSSFGLRQQLKNRDILPRSTVAGSFSTPYQVYWSILMNSGNTGAR